MIMIIIIIIIIIISLQGMPVQNVQWEEDERSMLSYVQGIAWDQALREGGQGS